MSSPLLEKQIFRQNIVLPNRERNILITSSELGDIFSNYVFSHSHGFIKPDIGRGLSINRDGCLTRSDRLSEDEMDIDFLDLTNLVRVYG